MNTKDLRNKSVPELEKELLKQLENQFKNKMQKMTGQLAQTHLIKQNRRNVARLKTVLNEVAGK